MIIVLILVVLWGVVLGPSIVRRIRSKDNDRSITSFHRSLDYLERSGPKVIEPAYRLQGSDGPVLETPTVSRIQAMPRIAQPTLVLLGPQGSEGEESMNNRQTDYYEEDDYRYQDDAYSETYDDGYDHYEDAPESRFGLGLSLPAVVLTRREAALRRRNILAGLVASVVITALLGLFMSFFFDLTVIAVIALGIYIGLMAYAAKSGMFGEKGYERHVARGFAPLERDHYQEPVATTRGTSDGYYADEHPDDEWWDEPRQAVAR